MTLSYFIGDLLEIEQGYYLAHSISGDFSLGAGIAAQINKNYDMVEKLEYFHLHSPNCWRALLIDNVFNLVVKNEISAKPTYEALETALYDMKRQAEFLRIKKIAIPKLCCGRDGLDWTKVESLIYEVFDDVDISILVVTR